MPHHIPVFVERPGQAHWKWRCSDCGKKLKRWPDDFHVYPYHYYNGNSVQMKFACRGCALYKNGLRKLICVQCGGEIQKGDFSFTGPTWYDVAHTQCYPMYMENHPEGPYHFDWAAWGGEKRDRMMASFQTTVGAGMLTHV